jgi:membrane protein
MARLRDVPAVLRTVGPWTFVKTVYREIGEDNLFTWGAAMAYSWLFAVFPFFIFLVTLVPYLPEEWRQEAERQLAIAVYKLPKSAADTLWTNLYPKIQSILHESKGGLLSIGAIVTLFAASGGMAMTMQALDKCYDVEKPRPFYKQRPLAVALTAVVATLIIAVIILVPVGTILTELAARWRPDWINEGTGSALLVAWQVSRYTLAMALLFGALGLIYYYGANHEHPFHFLTPGSVFSVAVWFGLGIAFRVYIDKYGKYNETYGAIGGVAILLLFFYLDSLVLLIGAELNSEVDRTVMKLTGKVEPPPEELLAATEAAVATQSEDGGSRMEDGEKASAS